MNEILDHTQPTSKPKIMKFKYVIALFIVGWIATTLGGVFKVLSWEGGSELFALGALIKIISAIIIMIKLIGNREIKSFLNS